LSPHYDQRLFVLNNRIAIILSVVFHPLIITTYLFTLLFFLSPDLVGVSAFELPALGSLLLLLFLNTFIAPTLVIYYFQKMGIISSLHVDDISERRLPYLACVIIYALATYLFGWQLQPIGELAPQISIILGSVTVSLILVMIISFFWKISAHATGIGGTIGILSGLLMRFDESVLLTPLLVTILIGGVLLSARLYLNAHTQAQILGGFLCGILVSSMTVYFFF
jgi:membrane-associated phospholipid phosphatase